MDSGRMCPGTVLQGASLPRRYRRWRNAPRRTVNGNCTTDRRWRLWVPPILFGQAWQGEKPGVGIRRWVGRAGAGAQ
ncbi:hypothetical protein D3C78_994220 [compost metagenome]